MGIRYTIKGETLESLADAVRYRTGTNNEMRVSEMIEELKKPYFYNSATDIFEDEPEPWVRPSGWPDLDSLNLEFTGDDSFVYMTYDADQENSAIAWYIYTGSSSNRYTVDIGHIENGEYVVDASNSFNGNAGFAWGLASYSGYVVVRITGDILRMYGLTASVNDVQQQPRQQPMLERIAYVPKLQYLSYSTSQTWGTWSLERERVGNKDGSQLTNVSSGYYECSRLRSLDISEFYVTSKCTSLYYTFYGCLELRELNVHDWDVSEVTTFSNTFNQCRKLTSLDLRGWDTGTCANFSGMFGSCYCLKEVLGLEGFDTSKATNISSMFYNCRSIRDLTGVKNFVTDKVTSLYSIFYGCERITELDLTGWDVSKVASFSSLFYECRNLKVLNISGWETGPLTSLSTTFSSCMSLQNVDISGWKVTNTCTSIYAMFNSCHSIKEINIPPTWDVSGLSSANSTANSMFNGCYSLEKITGIKDWNFQLTNSLVSMFNGCGSLKELDISGWNVSTITSFESMFYGCRSLKHLNLSNWETDNVTNMTGMFRYCYSLEDIGDVSAWDVSKVTTFSNMFQYCWSLKEIPDTNDWDMRAATTVANMFYECTDIKEAVIRNWNLANCTTIATMFNYCYSLRKVDFTGWQMPKVTSTAPGKFLGDCWNLEDVDMVFRPLAYNFANCRCLTHEAVVKILNALPQTSTSRTLTLMAAHINRLTTAEKQIATSKGWTLAT